VQTKRLLDSDPLTGIVEYYYADPVTGGYIIETQQDIEHIIELNKAVVNDNDTGWKGEWHHVAHIPLSILMKLAQDGIVTTGGEVLDEKRYRSWLNDPENQHFRVKRGRV
jgi:hypothetical protein